MTKVGPLSFAKVLDLLVIFILFTIFLAITKVVKIEILLRIEKINMNRESEDSNTDRKILKIL